MSKELKLNGFDPQDAKYYPDGKFNVNTYNTLYNRGKYFPARRTYALIDSMSVQEDDIFKRDMAQSRFFTIKIDSIRNASGVPIVFSAGKDFETGHTTYDSFLPVKSINLNFTGYDNLKIPFGSFADIPVLQKKRVSNISISCYDTDDDLIERALINWENTCFPHGKYVAYLNSPGVTARFEYRSYNVKGKLNYSRNLYVIPSGGVSVSRGYEDNGAKLLTFSVVAVGFSGGNAGAGSGPILYGNNYPTDELAVATYVDPNGKTKDELKNQR